MFRKYYVINEYIPISVCDSNVSKWGKIKSLLSYSLRDNHVFNCKIAGEKKLSLLLNYIHVVNLDI